MARKIIGSIGILVGLGLATFFLYALFSNDKDSRAPSPGPSDKPQVAVQPAPEPSQPPGIPAPGPAVPSQPQGSGSLEPRPPLSESALPPAVATVPTPTPPQAEQKITAQAPLEPKQEHGLLAGRYRSYQSAQKLLEKIKQKDIPALIRKKGKYYEVWAGPFPTVEEAEQAKKSLKVTLKISPKKGTLEIPVPK